MVDSFNRQVLRVAVAQICQSMGWDALQKSTHDTLTDVMQRYVEEIGKVAYSYTQLCMYRISDYWSIELLAFELWHLYFILTLINNQLIKLLVVILR